MPETWFPPQGDRPDDRFGPTSPRNGGPGRCFGRRRNVSTPPPPSVPARCRTCGICGNVGLHPTFQARERLLGRGTRHCYFQCIRCGCLQLDNTSEEMGAGPADREPREGTNGDAALPRPDGGDSRAYPAEYFRWLARQGDRPRSGILAALDLWTRKILFGKGLAGSVFRLALGTTVLASIARLEPDRTAAILDVGCGDGVVLRRLAEIGFTDLTGLDPLAMPLSDPGRSFRFIRQDPLFFRAERTYDLVMLHHVLEHVPDPHALLEAVSRWLAPTGTVLIRVPLADSLAWRRFGANWYQLDPPRHLFLHTDRSLRWLAARHGFRVVGGYRDSRSRQFLMSFRPSRDGFPRHGGANGGAESGWGGPGGTLLSRLCFALRARALNFLGTGDQGVFYLRPTASG